VVGIQKELVDPIEVVRAAKQLKNGDTIDVEGDHLVVFHFCEEYGQVVIDAVSAVSARRFELHYAPDARVSIL
jgi:hypothetical protein